MRPCSSSVIKLREPSRERNLASIPKGIHHSKLLKTTEREVPGIPLTIIDRP